MLVSLHHILISSLVFVILVYPTIPCIIFAGFEESIFLGVLAILLLPLSCGITAFYLNHDWPCYRVKHYCPECKRYIGRAKESIIIPNE